MYLTKASPKNPFLDLYNIDKFFEDAFRVVRMPSTNFPRSAVKYHENGVTYQLALAGWDEEDLTVEVTSNSISVTGKRDSNEDDLFASRAFRWGQQDPYGSYDFQSTQVNMKNGMLTLEIPVKEETKPRVLQITSGK